MSDGERPDDRDVCDVCNEAPSMIECQSGCGRMLCLACTHGANGFSMCELCSNFAHGSCVVCGSDVSCTRGRPEHICEHHFVGTHPLPAAFHNHRVVSDLAWAPPTFSISQFPACGHTVGGAGSCSSAAGCTAAGALCFAGGAHADGVYGGSAASSSSGGSGIADDDRSVAVSTADVGAQASAASSSGAVGSGSAANPLFRPLQSTNLLPTDYILHRCQGCGQYICTHDNPRCDHYAPERRKWTTPLAPLVGFGHATCDIDHISLDSNAEEGSMSQPSDDEL